MEAERNCHINHLELLAIIKAFRSFESLIVSRVVQVAADNTTALHYLNKLMNTLNDSCT